MSRLTINSITSDVFRVNNAEKDPIRASLITAGRTLAYNHAVKGHNAMSAALGRNDAVNDRLSAKDYRELNERFQHEHLVYCAKIACDQVGTTAPESFDEFKRMGQSFYRNERFFAALAALYQEIINPILPTVYSEAVSLFADVVEVGFGETHVVTVTSNDIPVFQDSAWGASRSVPRNRFYSKDYTLNPTPRTCQINAKWTQLVANGTDFGMFFANMAAGMYAKTMALWNAAMQAAAGNTALIPAGLTYTFSSQNWVRLANKLAAVNATTISNTFAFGNAVALSKVLPTNVTGSTNVNMDAAMAEFLGADYNRSGYLGEFMSVLLRPLTDVVIPGTQNGNVETMLSETQIWMMSGNGRKPLTIAYNRDTPITLEIDPSKAGDMEIGINMTTAIDSVAVFASKVGLINIP